MPLKDFANRMDPQYARYRANAENMARGGVSSNLSDFVDEAKQAAIYNAARLAQGADQLDTDMSNMDSDLGVPFYQSIKEAASAPVRALEWYDKNLNQPYVQGPVRKLVEATTDKLPAWAGEKFPESEALQAASAVPSSAALFASELTLDPLLLAGEAMQATKVARRALKDMKALPFDEWAKLYPNAGDALRATYGDTGSFMAPRGKGTYKADEEFSRVMSGKRRFKDAEARKGAALREAYEARQKAASRAELAKSTEGNLVPFVEPPKSIDEEFEIYRAAADRRAALEKELKASEGLKKAEAAPRLAEKARGEIESISKALGSRPVKGMEHGTAAVIGGQGGVTQPLFALPAQNKELTMNLVDTIMSNKEGIDWLKSGIWKGFNKGSQNWYDTSRILDKVGPSRRDELMFAMGPTSPMTEILTNTSKATLLDMLSKSNPGASPEELGALASRLANESGASNRVRYLLGNNARDFASKKEQFGDIPFPKNPLDPAWKTPSFTGGLQGFESVVPADTHVLNQLVSAATMGKTPEQQMDILKMFMTTGPEGKLNEQAYNDLLRGVSSGAPGKVVSQHPTGPHYTANQLVMSDVARQLGIPATKAQSSAWVGLGDETGLVSQRDNYQEIFIKMLEQEAARSGLPVQEVWDRLAREGVFLQGGK